MAKRNTFFQDEKIEKKIDFKQLMRTVKYVLPFKKTVIAVGLLLLVSSVTSLIPPRLLKIIVDVTVVNEDYKQLVMLCGAMFFLAVTEILVSYIQTKKMGKVGFYIISKIRTDIFDRLQQLSFDYYDNRPDGKIVVRVTEYINGLASFFSNYVLMFAVYIVKVVVVTVFMLSLSPLLTLVVFATVIPMILAMSLLKRVLAKKWTDLRAKNSNRSAFLVESIMGEQIIKNYSRIEKNKQVYDDIHMQSVHSWWKIVRLSRLNSPITMGFWNVGTLAIFGVALALILSGDTAVTAGTVVTFTSYMTSFKDPISQIANIIQELAQVSSNLEQVFGTIDYPLDIADKEDAVELGDIEGRVDFENVTFEYDEGVPILENFDLHVDPGKTVALVGHTGAGKTTVINMLTRFYDVKQGAVKIDGIDVRDIKLRSLRNKVGVLMQDPFIFKGTIMDNIRYGRWDATDEECIRSAKLIHADKFIERFPGGYDHMLEERGSDLSAGERQLISFARIVLKDPAIIIMDEATSAIDTETEMIIKEALDELTKDKTTFIVAHRLSTVKNADRILYIGNKGILESGTHEELIEKKGYYYELARI
ncbi:MAG: ABC transporter ATP-binding protein/permease [Lachnospiraceae bacterium]|nr:ABC transporter ATP-binding protein/permease [Lachnospiraceae bacterium]